MLPVPLPISWLFFSIHTISVTLENVDSGARAIYLIRIHPFIFLRSMPLTCIYSSPPSVDAKVSQPIICIPMFGFYLSVTSLRILCRLSSFWAQVKVGGIPIELSTLNQNNSFRAYKSLIDLCLSRNVTCTTHINLVLLELLGPLSGLLPDQVPVETIAGSSQKDRLSRNLLKINFWVSR